MKILIATNNLGKAAEFERILNPLGVEIVLPTDLGLVADIEENGATFAENALIKARDLYSKVNMPTLADDSGLVVDALAGRPGVHTARYGGKDISYNEKFRLLFGELEETEKAQRTARFVCSICCILADDNIIEVTASCEGYIGTKAAGEGGFGFDPIFYIEDGRSFAQISSSEKDEISHRGIASQEFIKKLKQQLKSKGE